MQFIKEVRDIRRFKEILVVLFEEGFDFLVEELKLQRKIPLKKRSFKKSVRVPHEQRLRKALERLGPTFIKFGQMLSVRPDLVPKHYIKELEKLQDHVNPEPFSVVQQQFKKNFGKGIKSVFSSFDSEPLASASISQVHKAVLKDGSEVAVKLQRPDVHKLIKADIEIMFYIAHLLEKHTKWAKKYQPVQIIDEFWQWTQKELDFKREALNIRRFARNFQHDKHVKIPRVYKHLTTERILVMEYIDGVELHNVKELKKHKVKVHKIIEIGFESVLKQVFVHGFFHADPHPGNILIVNNKRIAFVDFGIVGRFSEEMQHNCVDLFYAIIKNDAAKVVATLETLGGKKIRNKPELEDEVTEIIESLQESDVEHVKISRVLEELWDLSLHYNIQIPTEFALFGKAIITLEGIALEYDPTFRIVERSRPFLEQLLLERYNPKRIVQKSIGDLLTTKKYLEKIPEQTSRALERIEQGSIRVDIDDTDIQRLSLEIDKSSNRVAYSMLIASLLIVGALTINYGDHVAFALPLIPLLSFSAALTLIFILIVSILKEKHIIR